MTVHEMAFEAFAPRVAWMDSAALVFDASGMSGAQRMGEACALCAKRYPAPRVIIGEFAAGERARACEECGPAVLASAATELAVGVLTRAAELYALTQPDVFGAVLAAAPLPHGRHREPLGDGCRSCSVMTAAAVAVARHLQATEPPVGAASLPPVIEDLDGAHAWLVAWAAEAPPVPVVAEVLAGARAELAELPLPEWLR
ncbi:MULTISPECIES: hypothetical protein [Actinomadura]|uniref:Uncharacterized protein n=1 Tax=Actinomadura yumaensis TaxID=111807 RepID=A0ABW2CU46_9ACTN|nr:hypothetical protein [Actinomadura sp. J1-007]MWK39604.1 hypothetical protein [Actinomadura sp. J1-007]